MRKRTYLIGALTLAFAVSISAFAFGARTVIQTVTGDVCAPANAACIGPIKTKKRRYKPAKFHVTLRARDSADPVSCTTSPQPAGACRVPPASDYVDSDFDDDIKFSPNAVGKCNPSVFSGDSTATARSDGAACLVGKGNAIARFGTVGTPGTGDVPAQLSAFNSTNANQLVFHVDPGFAPFDLTGTLSNSPQPGDYGKRLHTPVVAPGTVLVTFDITVNRGRFVTARCKDRNKLFNFHFFFHYGDSGVAPNNYPASTNATDTDRCKRIKPRRRHRRR